MHFLQHETYQPTGFSRRRCVTAAAHTYITKPKAANQALYTQRETRNYGPHSNINLRTVNPFLPTIWTRHQWPFIFGILPDLL